MPDEKTKLNLKFSLSNIAPHSNTTFEVKDLSSVNLAIYANNGSGKSFISRSFRQFTELSNEITGEPKEDIEQRTALYQKRINAFLTFEKDSGNFAFEFSNNKNVGDIKSLNVVLKRDARPVITNKTDLLFHTFNSDYVRENLEAVKYKPDDNISGFIMGKINIDLSTEKAQLKKIEELGKNKVDSVKKKVEDAKKELRELQVVTNTIEYKDFTYDNLAAGTTNGFDKPFSKIKELYSALTNMPELEDISRLQNVAVFTLGDDIRKVLSTAYSISCFEEAFKLKIKAKQGFIEEGLRLISDDACPFCEQKLEKDALMLISQYSEFIKDEESQVNKNIDQLISGLDAEFLKLTKLFDVSFVKIKSEFDNAKKYFPSFMDLDFENMGDLDSFAPVFTDIINSLKTKKQNISIILTDDTKSIGKLLDAYKKLADKVDARNQTIQSLNKSKNNIASERLSLRKDLCTSSYNEIQQSSVDDFAEISDLREQYLKIKKEIEDKENVAQTKKRQLVVKELKQLLKYFFDNKYDFDDEKFCVTFSDKHLVDNADDVLSDGEKGILAFCFYLASIHSIVTTEDDYKKVFFIIDDPVSSMDFHFVYAVVQCIKDLKKLTNTDYVKYIILTHNMEFMSVLIRNKVANNCYVLSNGEISSLNKELIMPYEANLRDIYDVAELKIPPNHTTPNSFRHIVETIHRFCGERGDLSDFIASIEELKGNGFANVMMNDCSHGIWRSQIGYTTEMLVSACKGLIDYISKNFAGQIEHLKKQ